MMQIESNQKKRNGRSSAAWLMVLCLMVQATAVFGQLNFDVTLYSLTNNNISAYSNYNESGFSANYGPTTAVDTAGDTLPINPAVEDMSLNPITPGHVSHVDVHTLIPSRPDLRWFIHAVVWFTNGGGNGHINIGYSDNTTNHVAAMISDMEARGFNGVAIDWYGSTDGSDGVTQKIKAYLASSANTNKNFHYAIQLDGGLKGGVGIQNLTNNIIYCETQYFNDTNYETEPVTNGNPILLFFGVRADTSEAAMEAAKAATAPNTLWVEQGNSYLDEPWENMAFEWTHCYDDGVNYSDPFDLNGVTNAFSSYKSYNTKQVFGGMCAHFNGTLTKIVSWSLGKYLPSSNGLCEVTRAATYNTYIPGMTNMTRMMWPTWDDWEEGTECEDGIENNFALTTAMSTTNILAWNITSGYEATIDHYDVYAQTNGGNAAWLCAVTNGVHQVNVSQYLSSGSYQLYVNAVGKPCVRDHMSTPTAYSPNSNLPFPWNNEDIGSPGLNGNSTYTNGTFTVAGSGDDIWGSVDEFQYAYQPWTGNGQIVAEVNGITDTAPYAKAALMFRSSLADNSANGLIFVSPTEGVLMQSRTNTGAETATVGTAAGTVPNWISLILSNNVLTGYTSPDGKNWAAVGTNNISLGTSLYVGMAVSAASNSLLNTSIFSNVTVSAAASAGAALISDLQPLSQTVWQSTPVSFTVAGGGLGAIHYQWMLNGQNIPGATNASYAFGALAGANYYQATISNSFGSATSSTAEVVGEPGTFLGATNNYYGTQITFNGDTNGGSLQDFPVLVRLSMNVPGFSYAQFVAPSNGADLRFTDSSGTRFIPFEIDQWNTNGVSTVWVQVPVLSTNTSIWAYWGNAAAAAALPSTNVWIPQPWEGLPAYDVVYHLKESGFPYADSTGQHPALTGSAPTPTTAGVIGTGENFGGVSYLDAGVINLSNAFTLSAWVNTAISATSIQAIWASKAGGSSNGFAFYVNTYQANDQRLLLETSDHANTPTFTNTPAGDVSSNQWHEVVAVVNRAGGAAQLYVDGIFITSSGSVLTDFNTNQDVRLGEFEGNDYQINGLMDEARIQSGLSSSNWVWASWATVANATNSGFATYGTVVSPNELVQCQMSSGKPGLTWATGTLQSAPAVTGPFTNVTGVTSPYQIVPSNTHQYFRIKIP